MKIFWLYRPFSLLVILVSLFLFNIPSFASISDQARELLRKASGIVAAEEGYKRSNAIRDLVMAQSNLGDWSGALKTVELEEDLRFKDQALTWVVLAKARGGDFESAYELAKTHSKNVNRDHLMNVVARAAAEQGHFKRAFSVAKEISDESGHWVWVRSWIAIAQVKKGNMQGALETGGQVAKYHAYIWSNIFREYAKSGDLNMAVNFSKELPEYWEKGYAQLGIVWGRLGIDDIDGAKSTAKIIEWIHPRGLAFIAIANKQIEEGLLQEARKSLKKAQRAILKMPLGEVRGDALWQLATVQAKTNDIKSARLTAGEISTRGHWASAIRDIAHVQAKSGDYAGALQTSEGFEDFAFPSPFQFIVQEQVRNGDINEALSTALGTPKEFRVAALAEVASEKAKVGDIQGILMAITEFSDEEKGSVLSMVAKGMAQARQYKKAMDTIANIQVPYLQQRALELVAGVQFEQKEWELAKVTAGKSSDKKIYKELSLAWSQSGALSEVLEWVDHLTDPFAKTYGLIGISEGLQTLNGKDDSEAP